MGKKAYISEEITIVEIMKIIYRYRRFLVLSVLLVTLLCAALAGIRNSRSLMAVNSKIIMGNTFGIPLQSEGEVNAFLQSNKMFETVKKEVGTRVLGEFLNHDFQKNLPAASKWVKRVYFKGDHLYSLSENSRAAIRVNLALLKQLMAFEKNLLEERLKAYFQKYEYVEKYFQLGKKMFNMSLPEYKYT
ncbi:MAG: hypothetical protein PHF84_11415, partial [bacterium]|nr:hypothetical protein [bacterium]